MTANEVRFRGTPVVERLAYGWRVLAPMFVASEFGWRWDARKPQPMFYVPPLSTATTPGQWLTIQEAHESLAECAWHDYQGMLDAGVPVEVARNVLPSTLFVSFLVGGVLMPRSDSFGVNQVLEAMKS